MVNGGHINHSEDILNSFTEALESANLSYDSQSGKLTGDGVQTSPTETQLTQLRLLLLKLRRKIVVELLRQGASISAVRACVESYSSQETADKASLSDRYDPENNKAGSANKDNSVSDDIAGEEGRDATVIKIGGDGDKIHIKLEKRSINPDDKSKKRKHILVSGDEDDVDDDHNGSGSRKDDATNTPISIKFEDNDNDDDDNDFKIDLTSAIDSDSNKIELIDDPDDEGLRPRKKIRVKLEDDEEESIKLIISKDRGTGKEDDVFIPSVYRSDNPDANEILNMDELVKTSMKELQLYDDEENHKTARDEVEYKKRKFAVSEFPESDLKDMLPGEIPMLDFSGPKPTQQVAWNSFTAYIEPFYRNFTEDDVKWLRQKCVASSFLSKYLLANEAFVVTENSEDANAENKGILAGNGIKEARPLDNTYNPYYIPPLGPKYSDVWMLENEGKPVKMGRLTQSLASKMKKLYAPKGSPVNFDANKPEALVALCEEQDKVSCGPLTSRILSAIVSDDEDDAFELDQSEHTDGENGEDSHNDASTFKRDDKISFEQLEKRLNRELKYIGVFMNVVQTLNNSSWEQDWALGKEDDEVSSELRILQNELTKVQKRNNFRKEILVPIVEEQIAWQEYMTIVDDLDKQVEQHYRRRLNVTPKKTKKRGPHSSHSGGDSSSSGLMKDDAAHLVSNASFRGLLDKRRRWIEKIGSLFKSPLEMRRMPKHTVFKVAKEEEEEEEKEEEEADGEKEGNDVEVEVMVVEEGEADSEKEKALAEGDEEEEGAKQKETNDGEKSGDRNENDVDNGEKKNDDEPENVEKDSMKEKDTTAVATEKTIEKKADAKEVKAEANVESATATATTATSTAGDDEEEDDEENEEEEEDDENDEEEDEEEEDDEEEDEEEEEVEDDDEEMAAIEEEPEEDEEDDDEQDDDDDDDDEENEEDDDEEEEEDDDDD